MLFFQAVILGIVQGLTEFIPISSSAHLIIVPWLFGWNDAALTSLPFDVALHMGTLLAVLVYFARDWLRLIQAFFASLAERKIGADPGRRFVWLLVIATIPGAIVGALAEKKIEALFHTPGVPIARNAMIVMAVIIALLGLALLLADRLARHQKRLDAMTVADSIWIGLSQALSIFPGVSRSGATITTALGLGFERDQAARFSFMLSAPIIAGAGLKSLLEIFIEMRHGALAGGELAIFPVGLIVAAISGFLCIKYLLQYLQNHSTAVFVYYRWALALLIVVVALLRP
jgi:undecaprenyl-diphosphatase